MFKGALDAFAYLIISAIIPVTYLVVDIIAISSSDTKTMVAASLTLMSFFASCAYDYDSRYNDESETKKPIILNVLLLGVILYCTLAVATFVGMILIVTDVICIDNLKLVYILFFVAGLYAPMVSFIEVFRFVRKKHKNKLAKARGV